MHILNRGPDDDFLLLFVNFLGLKSEVKNLGLSISVQPRGSCAGMDDVALDMDKEEYNFKSPEFAPSLIFSRNGNIRAEAPGGVLLSRAIPLKC